MPTQRIVLKSRNRDRRAASAIAPASSQEYRGTWEQQMACTPDVWRLCSDRFRMSAGSWRACGRTRRSSPIIAARCSKRMPNNSRPIVGRRSVVRSRRRHVPARRNRCSRRRCSPSRDLIMRKTNRPALPGGPVLADVDPFRRSQFRHPRRRDLDCAVGRACRGHHDVECFQRHVAIDRQRRLQSERTDAADFMPGDLGDLVEAEHFRLAPEQRLHLLVVHA